MRYAFLVVEGQHDVAAIGKMLKLHGARQLKTFEALEAHGVFEHWMRFVKLEYPVQDRRPPKKGEHAKMVRDFTKRMPTPTIYQLPDVSIAVRSADGDIEKIVKTLAESFANWDEGDKLSALGLFCDADDKTPQQVFEDAQNHLQRMKSLSPLFTLFTSLTQPGEVVIESDSRVGLYIFPDNENAGTLENLLIECGDHQFPDLVLAARDYVGTIKEVYGPRWNQSKQLKVTVGCMANVLRPGKANQVSIQEDNWFCEDTLALSSVSRLHQFLAELLHLS